MYLDANDDIKMARYNELYQEVLKLMGFSPTADFDLDKVVVYLMKKEDRKKK